MTHRFNIYETTKLALATGLLILTPGLANAQAPRCSVLAGTYAAVATGTPSFPGTVGVAPVNFVAIQTFDGAGKSSAVESGNINGQIIRSAPLSGTYTLKPDCSGTMTAIFPDGSTGSQDFVVANGGKTIYAIAVDSMGPGNTLTTIFTRMK
jgi:hypothetical protein